MIPAFINPAAGNAAEARAALDAVGGFDIREVPPATLADQVRVAVDEGARRLLVAGGDGSIGSAANVIAGTRAELAILPCGTLNHLAKDLSLPLALEDAARVALNGCVTSVNAAVVNDRLFLNTSSVGAYITFVRARERLEGRLGYHIASFVAATRLLFRMPTFRVTLRVEDEDVDRHYITPLVFIGVGERELRLPSLGARVPDGKSGLHVMVVRRRSGARALAAGLAAAARGVKAVARTPALDAFLVESCRIESRTTRLSLDGELVSLTPPFEYRHVPAHLRVVVPDPKNAS
ncbi:MAG TPA: diacylglycerol kinase family protein [Gemmatimonadaceae bacterium]|jgi:diacylglycerol kinase family enzyme|nr:diacylglycerol kinase family protein [Gemmatimonadaceae bacterium]